MSKSKSKAKDGRGRPAKFSGNVKRHVVALVKKHGATGAQAVLAKEKPPIVVSIPTLCNYGRKGGAKLHRGRPSKAA